MISKSMPGSRSVVFDFLSAKERQSHNYKKRPYGIGPRKKTAFKLIDYFYFTTSTATIIINICIYQYITAFFDIKEIDLNPSQANSDLPGRKK